VNKVWSVLLHQDPTTNAWLANTGVSEDAIKGELANFNVGTLTKLYGTPQGLLYEFSSLSRFFTWEYKKKYSIQWVALQFLHDTTIDEITNALDGVVDTQLIALLKNKSYWSDIVRMLNTKSAGNHEIEKLSLREPSTIRPIADVVPLLHTVDNDLSTLARKIAA